MSGARPALNVTVTREDGLWAAVVDGELPGVVAATGVECLADVEEAVRDLLAGLLGELSHQRVHQLITGAPAT